MHEEPMFGLLRDYHFVSCNKARIKQGDSAKYKVYAKEIVNQANAYEDSSFKVKRILDKHRFLYSKVSSYVHHLKDKHVKVRAHLRKLCK